MTSAPTTQPMRSATCCRHGVAPTSQPVLRSCILSFEMQAMARMIEVVKMAVAVANFSPPGISKMPNEEQSAYMTREATMMPRMPMPEIGLEDVPTRPAM